MFFGARNSFDSKEIVSKLINIDLLYDDLQSKKLLAKKSSINKCLIIYKELGSIFFVVIFVLFLPLFLYATRIVGGNKKKPVNKIFVPTENKRLKSNREIFEHDYFSKQNIVEWHSLPCINLSDLRFILKSFSQLKLQLGFFLVVAKTIFLISKLRALINTYNPRTICMYNEWDLITPTIHKYLEMNNILYEILMHGDKAYELADAYTSADLIYVWSSEYKKIFRDLRVKAKFKDIGFPKHFIFKIDSEIELNEVFFIPPIKRNFVGNEQKIHKDLIVQFVSSVKPQIKLHPKYHEEQKKFLELESYDRLINELKFDKSSVVVGYVSTVLYRAAVSGICVRVIKSTQTNQMSRYHPLFSMENVSLVDFHDIKL